jgi:hypothetical protein
MRTNKFRAWDKIHNKMSNSFTLLSAINQDQAFVNPENFDYMQYTGLKDKNGVEIYEGYIIALPTLKKRYPVVIEPMGVGLRGLDGVWQGKIYFRTFEMEVVGNIYENPELLEDKTMNKTHDDFTCPNYGNALVLRTEDQKRCSLCDATIRDKS